MKTITTPGSILLTATLLGGLAGCTGEGAVSYSRDVQPILQANCLSCHQAGGAGHEASGFSMATYADLMKGTSGGAMIVPGDSAGSAVVEKMLGGSHPALLSEADLAALIAWIDAGAPEG